MSESEKGVYEVLIEHPFFEGLGERYIALLAEFASYASFAPGDYLLREGEEANSFYIITFGQVSLEMSFPGKGSVTLHTVKEGDVVGWSWLHPPYKWFLDARAVTQVRAIAFDGRIIKAKCDEDPHLGYELMKRFACIIAQRLQATRLQLLDIHGASG
ncbi:MAG: cyclic nucleotide-binding domain-containing protein [Candidatus Methanosuratincola sp.]|jgi:CRP-like cAMP-binding protein